MDKFPCSYRQPVNHTEFSKATAVTWHIGKAPQSIGYQPRNKSPIRAHNNKRCYLKTPMFRAL